MSRNQTPSIIFDFDGVIADSFEVFVESLEKALRRPERLTKQEVQRLRGLTTIEVMHSLGVHRFQLPRLVVLGRREVLKRIDRVVPHPGMPEVIRKLATTHRLFIVSTNSRAAITGFLDRNDLTGCFEFLSAGAGMFNKGGALRRLIKRKGISRCLYVGDETRDIESAKRAGIRCAVVDWGYSTPELLAAHAPDMIISKPEEMLSLDV